MIMMMITIIIMIIIIITITIIGRAASNVFMIPVNQNKQHETTLHKIICGTEREIF